MITDRLSQDPGDIGDRPEIDTAELVLLGEEVLPATVLAPWAAPLAAQVQEPTREGEQRWVLDAMTIAACALPRGQRQPFVDLAFKAAQGELAVSQDEELTRDHPLDRFRLRTGPSMLRQQALVAAARLAGTELDTAPSIVTMALGQPVHATDAQARLITRALSHLATVHLPPLTALAVHHQPWVRCLAASLKDADSADLLLCQSMLADDPDWRVRVNLARHLPQNHSLLTRLHDDAHRQVRQAAQRLKPRPAPADA
ncbi:hypothetical protein ACWEQW_32990 [Streptomyces nigra]